jgi:purine nucleosidase
MKLLIDTDVGIDDAVALLMALAQPDCDIKAITTIVGNVPLAQATHNAGVVLDIANAPLIPIYRGCAKPLLQYRPDDATEFYGADGLGGAGQAQTSRIVESEHASLAMIRLAREHPAELTLLTLGPLTNVALAVRLEPAFLGQLKRIVMMAGAVDGRGNTSPPAEFNISVDPEAAKIVFAACAAAGVPITLISWEATLAHEVPFSTWDSLTEGSTPTAQFLQAMSVFAKDVMLAYGYTSLLWPDPLAAAVALAPEIVLEQECRFLDVETGPNLARGQTIVDYRTRSDRSPNAHIVRTVDRQKFHELLRLAANQK